MQNVSSPYFDPEFESLAERINGPACRVSIDNDSLEDCTIVKINSVSKEGMLLEVIKVLTDVNLTITKAYVSSDAARWFMDVFHVKDNRGNKVTDQRILNYIQQAIGGKTSTSSKVKTLIPESLESGLPAGPTAIEITGTDRPGLFSEISSVLADLHCNIVEAHVWSHNARLVGVAYISDDAPIDGRRLAVIENHLTTVLEATTNKNDLNCEEAKLPVSDKDYDHGPGPGMTWRAEGPVWVDSCEEKGYSIVSIKCRDRKKLMFDTVCTLTDMQYVIFHASLDSHDGVAFQEYFIRHIDGHVLNNECEMKRIIKCLEAAIERRVCEGIRIELCAYNRLGLLSDITRVLRESGLVVVRADIAAQGEKSTNAFYVRDITGSNIDMEFLEAIKREICPIHIMIKNEPLLMVPTSPCRSRLSIGDMLKCQIGRFSHRLVCQTDPD